MPAPVGGVNATSPASAMPPTDCLHLFNMIPFQYGLRVRSGWREWCTGVGAATVSYGLYDYGSPFMFHTAAPLGGAETGGWTTNVPGGVRSILPFSGSARDGSNDRLWACTSEGIWDCSVSTDAPTLVFPFPDLGLPDGPAEAGRGVGTAFTNVAGDHYYAYCDGAHGYLLYSEKTQAWTQITLGSTPGTQIESWDPTNPVDPGSFRFVMQWKNRLWFVPEGSTTAWYLDVGAFAGPAYPIPFAPRFANGGDLVGLWSWTVDGGQGIDDHLVAISRGGDVVIYSGTDPALPGAFALRGIWWIGNVPPGRTVASRFGGDLFMLSVVGCVPLSKLVSGGMIRDPDIMASGKVANLFNKIMTERGNLVGWSIDIHPTDNLMIITVPPVPGKVAQQLTMSLASKGWSQHVNVPMACMGAWRNKLYFGTVDGRVCVNDGFVDGMKLDGTDPAAIDWSLFTSYQTGGMAQKKRVHMVRPLFMTDGTDPGYETDSRWDFDLTSVGVSPVGADPIPAWDTALWDYGIWDDSIGTAGSYEGAAGMGTHFAVVLRGTSRTEITLVGMDVVVEQGGIL